MLQLTIVLSILVTYFIDLWTGVPVRQLFYQYYSHTLLIYGLVNLCDNCSINITLILYGSMDWCTYATIVLSILVTYFINLWTGVPMRQLFCQYYTHTLLIYGLVYLCGNCFINISHMLY